MENYTLFKIFPTHVGFTPKFFGVNVETQHFWKETNLWDWLADSGFSFVREFAPDFDMRYAKVRENAFSAIRDRADFNHWRKGIRQNPDGNGVDWSNYRFQDEVPWHGHPDGVVEKTMGIEVQPMISIGYHPKMYPRPLLLEKGMTQDREYRVDWAAAASCYEYAFAMIWHFASKFGVALFMTLNEPENQPDCWYLPPELDFCAEGFGNSWSKLFRDDAEPTGLGEIYLETVKDQYGAVAWLVRMAMEDVKSLLPELAGKFRLLGPSGVVYQPLWQAASPFLDSMDFHHYGEDPGRFDKVYPIVSETARQSGKTVSCSEYNRFSGGMQLDDFAFTQRTGVKTASLLMRSLTISLPGDPPLEFLAFYLFHAPSTHRNYKHLLYGDLNFLDWEGLDRAPWSRPETWKPTLGECLIRHTTPAYHFARMLTRFVKDAEGQPGPFPVLRSGMVNPTSAGPDDIAFQVEPVVIDQGNQVVITLFNPGNDVPRFLVETTLFRDRFTFGLVRRSSLDEQDRLLDVRPLQDGKPWELSLKANSMTQIILTSLPLDTCTAIELMEETVTPGTLLSGKMQLEVLQTTRLRATGKVGNQLVDLSE